VGAVLREIGKRLVEWGHYIVLGIRLGALAADPRSRLALAYLGATTILQPYRFWRGRPVRVDVMLGGSRYPVRLQTRTELDVLGEIGLDDEYGLTDRIPATTIVDLGAHVGLATLRLLAAHPGARVVAVEADPALIPRLRENLAGLPVEIVHAAISREVGEREFYRSDISSWGNSLERTLHFQSAVKVPTTTLDALLDSRGIDRVDLLKVDVEGAEWDLFADGPPERAVAIVGEVHARGERAPRDLIDRVGRAMPVRLVSDDPWGATFVAGPGIAPSD
jgi:FkbM family methyltransferase